MSASGIGLRAPAPPTSARGLWGRGALVGLVAGSLLIALAAGHTAALLPQSIRPAPPGFTGVLGASGIDLHVAGAAALLILMCGCYLTVIWTIDALPGRLVLAAVVACALLILLAAPLASTDVFSYEAYARMGADYGIDPYTHGPLAIRLDPIFAYVGARWSNAPSSYGPLFTAGSELFAGLGIAAAVLAFKAVAVAAGLGLVAVVGHIARLRGLDPVQAIAFVGLNPLLIVYGEGGAHNDLLMLALLMLGVWALLRGLPGRGGALAVGAIGVKLTAAIALPFALVDPRSRPGSRRGRRLLLGVAVALAALVALGAARFGSGPWHLLTIIHHSQADGGGDSIRDLLTTGLRLPGTAHVVAVALAVGFVVAVGVLLVAVWRGRLDWIDATGWATLALLVSAASLQPWYLAWLLPFAALARGRRLSRLALGLTGVLQGAQLLGTLPHG